MTPRIRRPGAVARVPPTIAAILLITVFGPQSAQAQTATFLLQWGSAGTGDGQFQSPFGIAVDPAGYVYVCDQFNNRIQKFGSDGSFVAKWGSYGLDPGQFDVPHSIGIDGMGHVVVADRADRLQVFTSDGALLYSWAQPDHASPTIRDITVDASGVIYIADDQAALVEKYTLDGSFLGAFGGAGTPGSVAVDPASNIYLGRYGEIREIVKLDPTGSILAHFGQEGTGDGSFESPVGLAATNSFVYVVDYQTNRVQVFTSAGAFISKWGGLGSTPGKFNEPVRIALAGDGTVYVVDLLNNRIQKFGDLPTPVILTSWGALKSMYR